MSTVERAVETKKKVRHLDGLAVFFDALDGHDVGLHLGRHAHEPVERLRHLRANGPVGSMFHQDQPSERSRVLLGLVGFSVGCTGFKWVKLGYTGFPWASLSFQ